MLKPRFGHRWGPVCLLLGPRRPKTAELCLCCCSRERTVSQDAALNLGGGDGRGYYSQFCLTLLIRKAIHAVTVMFAVMKIIQKQLMLLVPVNMYQTISKHVMFRHHCLFLLQIWLFELFCWCWNSGQICSREFLTSTISNFMRQPRAVMHTKRSATTS